MNPPRSEHNSLLKGMGDETLIGLLHIMSKKHSLLIKSIGTTSLNHAPGRDDRFSIIKLTKVDSDTLFVH